MALFRRCRGIGFKPCQDDGAVGVHHWKGPRPGPRVPRHLGAGQGLAHRLAGNAEIARNLADRPPFHVMLLFPPVSLVSQLKLTGWGSQGGQLFR